MRLTGSVRRWLREETRAEHDAVDAGYGAFDLTRLADYRRFLQAHARAVLPLETSLDAAGAGRVLSDWRERRRAAALLADLIILGGDAPDAPSAPQLVGEAQALGALYVLEGSRLGARLLARRVSASPDPSVRAACAYLDHCAGQGLWPTFLAVLDASPAVLDRPQEALAGARVAFNAFRSALPVRPSATL